MGMMMGVMVKMSNGDVERFEHATKYQSGFGEYAGYLYVSNEDGSRVAQFAPGGWSAVWEYPFKRTADAPVSGGFSKTVHRIYIDGQAFTAASTP
jgi:hypothetical protein